MSIETGPAFAWQASRIFLGHMQALAEGRGEYAKDGRWEPKPDIAARVLAVLRDAVPVFVARKVWEELLPAARSLKAEAPMLPDVPEEWWHKPLIIVAEPVDAEDAVNGFACGFCDGQSFMLPFIVDAGRDAKPWIMLLWSDDGEHIDGVHLLRNMGIPEDLMSTHACLWYAAMTWMMDRIASVSHEVVGRAARRRLGSRTLDVVGDWRVVTMRQFESTDSEAASASERNYSHRWLVKAHWRRLSGRRTWVRMHSKGPVGAPMLAPRREVWQVTR